MRARLAVLLTPSDLRSLALPPRSRHHRGCDESRSLLTSSKTGLYIPPTTCDARNSFRIRFYENCRVSLALSSLFALFLQRAFDNPSAINRIRTLSKNSRVAPLHFPPTPRQFRRLVFFNEPLYFQVLAHSFSRRRHRKSFHFCTFRTLFITTGGVGGVSSPESRIVVSSHSVNILLNEVECRVLGSLIEKEITTPEYYPLSLNALVNACNQKSNRDPVMNLDDAAVRQALHSLDGQSLVRSVSAADSRVTKYEHRLQEAFNFYRDEIAILCVLLLRGPQTPGELRTRAERMHPFDDLSAVQSSLQHLMKREPPLVKVLPRQPGTKEARYAHLLAGDVEGLDAKPAAEPQITPASADGQRMAHLEREVADLRNDVADFQKEVADLKQQFAQFKKQFE